MRRALRARFPAAAARGARSKILRLPSARSRPALEFALGASGTHLADK